MLTRIKKITVNISSQMVTEFNKCMDIVHSKIIATYASNLLHNSEQPACIVIAWQTVTSCQHSGVILWKFTEYNNVGAYSVWQGNAKLQYPSIEQVPAIMLVSWQIPQAYECTVMVLSETVIKLLELTAWTWSMHDHWASKLAVWTTSIQKVQTKQTS